MASKGQEKMIEKATIEKTREKLLWVGRGFSD